MLERFTQIARRLVGERYVDIDPTLARERLAELHGVYRWPSRHFASG